MYTIRYGPCVRRDFKQLDKPVILAIKNIHFPALQRNPYLGEPLTGKFKLYWKYKFNYNGVDYRISYEINNDILVIMLILVATRENFYKQLARRIK